jgi:hypothetical protein
VYDHTIAKRFLTLLWNIKKEFWSVLQITFTKVVGARVVAEAFWLASSRKML